MAEKDFRVKKGIIVDGTGYSSIRDSLKIGHVSTLTSNNTNLGGNDAQLRISGRGVDEPGIIQISHFDGNNFYGGTGVFTLGKIQFAMNENSNDVTTVASIEGITSDPNTAGEFDGALKFFTSQGSGSGASLTEKMILTADGNVGIGITAPAGKLQVVQNDAQFTFIAGADVNAQSLTDDTRKFMRFGMPHYDTDEQSFSLITGDSNDGVNQLYLGGGTGVGNAASNIFFNTAANSTTLTGTTRMAITDDGKIGIGDTNPLALLHLEFGGGDTTTFANTNETYRNMILLRNNTVTTNAFAGIAFDVSTESDFDSIGASIAAVRDTSASSTAGNHDANLAFSTNDAGDDGNTERMRITHDGNVGIGTTSPAVQLHVAGSADQRIRVQDTTDNYAVTMSGKSDGSFLFFGDQDSGEGSFMTLGAFSGINNLDTENRDFHLYGTNTTTGFYFDESAGKFGIGTTSPDSQLDISSASTATLRLSNSDTGLTEDQITGEIIFYQDDDSGSADGITGRIGMRSAKRLDGTNYYGDVGDMGFFVAGSGNFTADTNAALEAMTIRAGGKVGIGTTVPRSQLDVRGAAGSPGHLSLSTAETTIVDGDIIGKIDFVAPSEADGTDAVAVAGSIWVEADDTFDADENNSSIIFATGASEAATRKMRLNDVGSLFLNTGDAGVANIFGFRDRTDMGVKANTAYSVGLMAPDNVHITTDSNNNGGSNYIDFGHGSQTLGSHESMMRLVMAGTTGPGKLGIGTTSPSSTLDVVGTIECTGLKLQDGTLDYGTGKQQSGDLAVGWYTVAYAGGRDAVGSVQRAFGEFLINDVDSSRHGTVRFNATHFFGAGESIQAFAYNFFSVAAFTKLRIKSGGTYSGAAIQVYIANANNNVESYMTMTEHSNSWLLLDTWLLDTESAGAHDALMGYGSDAWANFAVAEELDLSVFNANTQGGIFTTGGLKAEEIRNGKAGTNSYIYLSPDTNNSFILASSSGTDVTLAADDDLVLHADDDIFLQAGGATKMTLLNDGNVGIGTTAPDTTLHVEGSVLIDAYEAGAGAGLFFREGHLNTNQPSITVQDHSGANPDGLAISAFDGISFRLNAVEKARLDSAGKFGIGTDAPAHLLHVVSAGNSEIEVERTSGAAILLQAQSATGVIGTSSNHTLALMTNGSQRVKISNGGGIESVSSSNGWNLWHKMVFGKVDLGTAIAGSAGLNTLRFDEDTAGGLAAKNPIPKDITIRAVHFMTQGVVLSGTVAQVWRIFANGSATSGTLTDISLNAGNFTRRNSENSGATEHTYTVTGLTASYNAGDTIAMRRNSGAVDMGTVAIEVYYSIDN